MKTTAATKKKQFAVKRRTMVRKVQIYGMTKEDLQYILDALEREREMQSAAEDVNHTKTASA